MCQQVLKLHLNIYQLHTATVESASVRASPFVRSLHSRIHDVAATPKKPTKWKRKTFFRLNACAVRIRVRLFELKLCRLNFFYSTSPPHLVPNAKSYTRETWKSSRDFCDTICATQKQVKCLTMRLCYNCATAHVSVVCRQRNHVNATKCKCDFSKIQNGKTDCDCLSMNRGNIAATFFALRF